MRDIHGLEVHLAAPEEFGLENEDLQVLLFQVARELLFNVVKHAGVECAEVELNEEGEDLLLTVTDEGEGFDPGESEGAEEGFGLTATRDRVLPFEGELEIQSAKGEGSEVTVRVPIGGSSPSEASSPETS